MAGLVVPYHELQQTISCVNQLHNFQMYIFCCRGFSESVSGFQTAHCGWGAFAAEVIKKDEFVIEYTGEGKAGVGVNGFSFACIKT